MSSYDDLDWSEYRRVRKNFLSQIRYYEEKYDLQFEGEKPLSASALKIDPSITQQDIDVETEYIRQKAQDILNQSFTPKNRNNYNDDLYLPSTLSDLKSTKKNYFYALDQFYDLLGLSVPQMALRTGRNNASGKYYDKPSAVFDQAIDSINRIRDALDSLVNSVGELNAGKLIFDNSNVLTSAVEAIRTTYKASDVSNGFTEVMEILSSGPLSYNELLGLAEEDEQWEED